MHRTVSLDYCLVVEGEVGLVLDSGEVRLLKVGDIAVQRGTMHALRTPSKIRRSRMVFFEACKIAEEGTELIYFVQSIDMKSLAFTMIDYKTHAKACVMVHLRVQ